ncbi:O-antigen ligase-like membrane protein [Micromonospora palomenae]|uniref:O-antigen ligase-like membrane protein n=1 Tax=Micromonospora palomenae TaxID=1461247 RepID=A0A561VHT4_9ACTN|nr:O-antigen ligase family protein [Micromonospora palomenae]TWG11182.1 O-antigen ligase-like membrane protein [Micromonospora palomenae]
MTWSEFGALVVIGCAIVLIGPWFYLRAGGKRATVAMLAFALVAVEELFASARNAQEGALEAPSIVAVGHQLHSVSAFGFPLLVLIAIAAAPLLVGLSAEKRFPLAYLVPVGLLMAAAAFSGLINGGPTSAAKGASVAVLILVGMVIGRHLRDLDDRAVARTLLAVMAVKAVVAALVTAGVGARSSRFVLYYDSVTPAVAAAILLAVFLRQKWDRLHIWLALTASVVLVLSPRRTPLLALVVSSLLLLVVARGVRVIKRALVVGALMGLGLVFSSYLPESLRQRIESGLGVLTGSEQEDSATGHFNDLYRGWELGVNAPFFGLGPNARQPLGLAANKANALYIHDEFLHIWVGLGLLAALALCALVILSTVQAARTTRQAAAGGASLVESIAACFLLQMPVVLVFFPYLSTTTRWPMLFGLAAVVVAGFWAAARGPAQSPGATTSATRVTAAVVVHQANGEGKA